MGLIKAQHVPPALAPFSMRDIEQQAQEILLRARQKAEQMLAHAQLEAQKLRADEKALGSAEGREEGLRTGYEEGLASGTAQALDEHRASFTQLITALNDATQQVEQSRRQLEEDAMSEVVRLAIAIADRVTKRRASFDGQVLTDNVIAAVKLVVHAADLRIAVNPSQRQTLHEILPQLAMQWPSLQHVELIEDADVAVGGCRLHARHGIVDADLNEQLNRIAAELVPAPSSFSPGTPGEGRGEGSSGSAQPVVSTEPSR
jgi:flagellar assembly protein FliH